MPSVPERTLAVLSRTCAVAVALMPFAIAAVLVWGCIAAIGDSAARGGIDAVVRLAGLTLVVVATSGIAGGALGVGAAIAAEELAFGPLSRVIDTATGFVGAIPAVAFGWIGVVLVAPAVSRLVGAQSTAALTACVVLAMMTAPTACALTSRALRQFPDSLREAVAAAGATRLQATALVVIPAMRSKISVAVLAAIGRATGEAAAVQIVFAVLAGAGVPLQGTLASWSFASAAGFGQHGSPVAVALPALAVAFVALACGFVVSREYRGLEWA